MRPSAKTHAFQSAWNLGIQNLRILKHYTAHGCDIANPWGIYTTSFRDHGRHP